MVLLTLADTKPDSSELGNIGALSPVDIFGAVNYLATKVLKSGETFPFSSGATSAELAT